MSRERYTLPGIVAGVVLSVPLVALKPAPARAVTTAPATSAKAPRSDAHREAPSARPAPPPRIDFASLRAATIPLDGKVPKPPHRVRAAEHIDGFGIEPEL